jgi:hypothetical protein
MFMPYTILASCWTCHCSSMQFVCGNLIFCLFVVSVLERMAFNFPGYSSLNNIVNEILITVTSNWSDMLHVTDAISLPKHCGSDVMLYIE